MARHQNRSSTAQPNPTAASSQSSRLLTAREVAECWNVSLRSVRRFIAAGEVPVHRLGRAVRVSEADLERFLKARRTPIKAPSGASGNAAASRRKSHS